MCAGAPARMLWSFSRDGGVPLYRVWASVNPRTGTPTNAVWAMVRPHGGPFTRLGGAGLTCPSCSHHCCMATAWTPTLTPY